MGSRVVWVLGWAYAALAGCNGAIGAASGAGDTSTGGAGHGGASSGSGGAGGSVTEPPPPQPGLLAEYFDKYMDRTLQRVEPTLDNVWGSGAPAPEVGADRFSARFTGLLVPPESGEYLIATESDARGRPFCCLLHDRERRGCPVDRRRVREERSGRTRNTAGRSSLITGAGWVRGTARS